MAMSSANVNKMNSRLLQLESSHPLTKAVRRSLDKWTTSKLWFFFFVGGSIALMYGVILSQVMPTVLAVVSTVHCVVVLQSVCSQIFQLMASSYLDQLAEYLNAWAESLRTERPDPDTILNTGTLILDSISDFNTDFGFLLSVELGICFVGQIFSLFFLCLAPFTVAEITWNKSGVTVTAMLWQMMFGLRQWDLVSHGSKLRISLLKGKRAYQEWRQRQILLGRDHDINSYSVHNLENRLSNAEPVRPCDVFSLTNGAGLSSTGLLFTYAVILLQFRLDTEI